MQFIPKKMLQISVWQIQTQSKGFGIYQKIKGKMNIYFQLK